MDLHSHILIHCDSERDANWVYALCDGSYYPYKGAIYRLPFDLLERMSARKVAPRVVRIDKKGAHDVDLARLKQIVCRTLSLAADFRRVEEREGLTSS